MVCIARASIPNFFAACHLQESDAGWHWLSVALAAPRDEVSPGNMVLGRRKVHGWYFSFLEFRLHIRNENAWLHFASLQSDFVAKVDGGFSCVTRCLYQALVNKGQSYSLFRAGVPMKIGAENRLLLNCGHPHLRRFVRKSTPYRSVGAYSSFQGTKLIQQLAATNKCATIITSTTTTITTPTESYYPAIVVVVVVVIIVAHRVGQSIWICKLSQGCRQSLRIFTTSWR